MSDKPADVAANGAIPVVTADGKVGYLPAALANDPAATEGLKRASDTQIRGAQLKANQEATKRALDAEFSGSVGAEVEGVVGPAVAGAARGLTLGGSDAAIAKIGGDSARRKLLDYQDYAPVTSTVSEIGAIAGAAMLGDESTLGALPNAVGRLGARVGAGTAEALGGGLAARGAGVLARGAVEGAVFGGGATISEKVIHDAPITGEALIGGMAHGAAGGMVASGLLHGVGAGFSRIRGAARPSADAIDAIAAREFGEAAPGVGKAIAGDMKAAANRADMAAGPVEAGTYVDARGVTRAAPSGGIPRPAGAAEPMSAESFAADMAAGRTTQSPEHLQFYQNNAKSVEAALAKLRGATGPIAEGGVYRAPGKVDKAGDAYLDATTSGAKRNELGELWKNREVAFQDGAERIEGHSRDLQKAITEQQTAARVTDMATFGDAKTNHMAKLVDTTRFSEQADEVAKWLSKARAEMDLAATDTAVTKLSPAARKEFAAQSARVEKAIAGGKSIELFKASDDIKRFLGRHSGFGKPRGPSTEAEKMFNALYQDEGGLMHVLEHGSWGKAGSAQKAVNAAVSENIGFGANFRSGFVTGHGAEGGVPTTQANSGKVSSFLNQLTKAAADNDATAVRDMIRTRRGFLDATGSSYDHGPAAVKAIAAERDALGRMEATFEKATKETSLINQVKRLQAEEQAQKIGGMIGVVTDTLSKPVTTLHRLAQLEHHTNSVLEKLGAGTKKLAGAPAAATEKAPGLAAPKGAGSGFFSLLLDKLPAAGEQAAIAGASKQRKEFDRRAVTLSALQANPVALAAHVGNALGPFSSDAPKATAVATGVAMTGLQFLSSKMPLTRRDGFTLQPQLQPTSRASDSQIAQHMRYVEALDNPGIILELAHRGALTPDHVEAVKAVYPALYDKMRTNLFQELVTSKSMLPYGRRVQLGILLDLPTDQTLAPDFVSAVQATYSPSENGDMEPPPSKLSQLDVAGSSMTATQRAASGGLDR